MIKSLSTSVITMLVVYAISFSVFASPQDPIITSGKLKFYDIPSMLGVKKEITVDLTSPYDVYVIKLNQSADELDLDSLNFKLEHLDSNEYVQPLKFDQSSSDFNVIERSKTFTAITNISEWNALIMKPKNFSDPGYIYYYVDGCLYGIDIFFNNEPEYLKETVVESLLANGYLKTLSSYIYFKSSYYKDYSLISYQKNVDKYTTIDGGNHLNNYSYIRFRNKNLVDNIDKHDNLFMKSNEQRTEIEKKLGF